jgi:WD40 repeat protein
MKAFSLSQVALAFALISVFCGATAQSAEVSPDSPQSRLVHERKKPKADLPTVPSPDQHFFVRLSPTGSIRYFSADGELVRTFYQCSPVAAAFSSDGALLCSAGESEGGTTLHIWRLSDGKLLGKIKTSAEQPPLLAFSGDNKLLAATVGNTRLSVWELPSGQLRWFASVNRPISALAFDQPGSAVIVKCTNNSTKRLAALDGAVLPAAATKTASPSP